VTLSIRYFFGVFGFYVKQVLHDSVVLVELELE